MVGYFNGMDPMLLTCLVAEGYDTYPVSNGFDSHGKHIGLLNEKNKMDLIVGHLHKVVPTDNVDVTTKDILYACQTFNIPVLLLVPKELHAKTMERTDGLTGVVRLVDPADALDAAHEILAGE
ncbi:hypothetical protein IIA79_01595 [bacterium]|nr:hypothetical protein [bacterium]